MENLKLFYKIENGELNYGSGFSIPLDFIEYVEGNEPQEFIDAKNILIDNEVLVYDLIVAKQYLRDTDWYFVRQIEENIDIPSEILNQRVTYKSFIRENEV